MAGYRWLRGLGVACLVGGIAGCQVSGDLSEGADYLPTAALSLGGSRALGERAGHDIQLALEALPMARVADVDRTGVPTFITGQLGRLELSDDPSSPESVESLRVMLRSIAPVFRMEPEDLVLKKVRLDEQGDLHLRFMQYKNGLEVLGAELILHVRDGEVFAANGQVRDDLPAPREAVLDADEAVAVAVLETDGVQGLEAAEPFLAYRPAGARLELVYVVRITGMRPDTTPVVDDVLVNAMDGSILDRLPHIHSARNRMIYSANNGTSLPGSLKRSEGGAESSDSVVNTNYDLIGATYDCYSALFGRDSYNNAGATLTSSVHYSNSYVNAFWDGSQMVYGDGDGVNASNLALSMDVTAHELTHAVTENESALEYTGESGGLNEGMSDIFGGVCEWYRDGQVVSSDTWKVGEDVWTPSTSGDALRYMNDPVLDGYSIDYYDDYYDGLDVHYSSGLANLAFYLLSQGGTHPRGKSTISVTGIGIAKASQIFYKANIDIMTATSTFEEAKTATEQAASQLGYAQADIDSVTAAWQAVGVGVPYTPPATTELQSGVPVTNLSGSTGGMKYFKLEVPAGTTTLTFATSGGSGDVDLYVKFGATPTTSSYDCRPYLSGNNETCTFSNPSAGSWYVMLYAYSSYSSVSLTGTASAASSGGTLSNGVPVTNLSGSAGSQQTWTLSVPAGQTTLSFAISGGSGDADMYVKFGSAPTTSSYDCRPYKSGNSESCTFSNPSSGTWYVMLRGYSSYSGVTLTGTYASSALTDGVPVTNISGSSGSQQTWTLSVPSGKSSLTFSISGGSGDADMYVKYGSAPTTSSYNCRPYKSGNNETCTFSSPSSGTWYVMLRGYSSYSGVTLLGDYN